MIAGRSMIDLDRESEAAKLAVDLVDVIGASVPLRRKVAGGSEWAGPCPKCGGRDRFIVRPNGKPDMPPGFWCRQCHWTGTAIDWQMHVTGQGFGDAVRSLLERTGLAGATPEAIQARRATIAAEVRAETAEQAEHRREIARRMAAITASRERIDRLMREDWALATLADRGIPPRVAGEFGLGLDEHAGRHALVIPWTVTDREGVIQTRAIQYRYIDDGGDDRYRWHKGSVGRLYNADAVINPADNELVVVEGALKAVALWAAGCFSVCALPNKAGWQTGMRAGGAAWLDPFRRFDRVWITLDPDATPEAREAAAGLPNARVVEIPEKPDDALLTLGGDVDAFMALVRQGRPV